MKFKKLISVALILSMALSAMVLTGAAYNTDSYNGSVYNSEDDNYTAKKLSHTQQGVKTADGIVDYTGNGTVTDEITGVGDRAQSYSWSAYGYGDYVYIGTCANAMTNTLNLMKSALGDSFDEDMMKLQLNAMFNGHFFVEEDDGANPQGIFLKLNVKTGKVKLLMSKATTGTNCLFRNSVEYNGKLYFCGSVNGIPSVYQVDPENDDIKCVYQSMTLAEYAQAYKQGICVGIRGMCVYEDKLVVSLVGLNGAYICETSTPSDPDSFKVIADMDDLFNYPAYHYSDSIYGGSVWDMVEFNKSLYVVLCTGTPDNKPDSNTMQSFAMVRGDVDSRGNWKWTSVVGDQENLGSKYTYGIDPERTRSGAANLAVYNNHLYIGEYNDEEIALEDILFSKNCNFVNANLEQSVNLYRMDENENIELVVGDADNMFPNGSLTGYGSGFGRNENQYIWRMQVYNNKLYVGTFDTSSLLEPIGQFTNGDIINMTPEEWESQINYLVELINHIKNKKSDPNTQIDMTDVSNELTKSQKKMVVSSVNSYKSAALINENVMNKALDISTELDNMEEKLDEKANKDFIAAYEKLYQEFSKLQKKLPTVIENAFEKIISKDTIISAKSFIICGVYLSQAERGFDLYVLDKDMNVETVTTNGFGDPYNHGCRVFAVTNNGLSIGTANPFYGTQVWSLVNNLEEPTEPIVPTKPVEQPTQPSSQEPTEPIVPTKPVEQPTQVSISNSTNAATQATVKSSATTPTSSGAASNSKTANSANQTMSGKVATGDNSTIIICIAIIIALSSLCVAIKKIKQY